MALAQHLTAEEAFFTSYSTNWVTWCEFALRIECKSVSPPSGWQFKFKRNPKWQKWIIHWQIYGCDCIRCRLNGFEKFILIRQNGPELHIQIPNINNKNNQINQLQLWTISRIYDYYSNEWVGSSTIIYYNFAIWQHPLANLRASWHHNLITNLCKFILTFSTKISPVVRLMSNLLFAGLSGSIPWPVKK